MPLESRGRRIFRVPPCPPFLFFPSLDNEVLIWGSHTRDPVPVSHEFQQAFFSLGWQAPKWHGVSVGFLAEGVFLVLSCSYDLEMDSGNRE